jgi:plasmid rolling circle replication initiator protein Rep
MSVSALDNLTSHQEAARTASLEICSALQLALTNDHNRDWRIIQGLAYRIGRCAGTDNIWIAKDLHSADTGELYNGHGRLWRCHSKLCSDCVKHHARKNRKKLQLALANQKLWTNEDYYFLTLTQVNKDLSLMASRSIINHAWSLFRKRRYIRRIFSGYCKTEEFTVTQKGIHYHLHVLARSKFIKYQLVRRLWTESVQAAEAAAGTPTTIANADGMLSVVIKKVYDTDRATKELCKYITKSCTWNQIPESDLLDIAKIERFPRMFELGGSFALSCSDRTTTKETIIAKDTILDTETVSDALEREQVASWRSNVQNMPIEHWRQNVELGIQAVQRVRKIDLQRQFPFATFKTLAEVAQLRLDLHAVKKPSINSAIL